MAISANELRLGNYVRLRMHDYNEVDSHNEITGLDEESPSVNAITFDYLSYDEIQPIPLTEEWLLKFGALKKRTGIFDISRFQLIWKENYKYWYVIDKTKQTYLTKIEFVHEFQNFNFTLNAQELTLKELK